MKTARCTPRTLIALVGDHPAGARRRRLHRCAPAAALPVGEADRDHRRVQHRPVRHPGPGPDGDGRGRRGRRDRRGRPCSEGRARVKMILEPDKLGPLYSNARLLLRPKTGLNDMSIDMDPGTPQPGKPDGGELHDGDVLPVWNTLPNVNPDEVLAALDADTRRYLSIVANAGGAGLDGRGDRPAPGARGVAADAARHPPRDAGAGRPPREGQAARRTTCACCPRRRPTPTRSSCGWSTRARRCSTRSARATRELAASVERLPGALAATRDALTDTRALADRPAARRPRSCARPYASSARRCVDVRPLLRDGHADPARRPAPARARGDAAAARPAPVGAAPQPGDADLVRGRPTSSTTSSTSSATTRPGRRRATSSGSPGSRTTPTRSSRSRTRTARPGAGS